MDCTGMGCMGGMGTGGMVLATVIGILVLVGLVLGVAALIKYLRSPKS